jgi:hypothetical protein
MTGSGGDELDRGGGEETYICQSSDGEDDGTGGWRSRSNGKDEGTSAEEEKHRRQ